LNSDAAFRTAAEAELLKDKQPSQPSANGSGKPGPVAAPKKREIKLPQSTDALTIFSTEFAEQAAVITDLLYSGVTLFAGRPKVGKSWLTLLMALAVAIGKELFGRFSIERPGRVVYVALEEPQKRTHTRLRKLLEKPDVALGNMHFIYQLDPLMSGGALQLDAYLEVNPASLMIIDTLLAVVRANGKRDVLRSDYEEVNVLRQLAEKHDVAIIVVHHLRKMGADYGLDAVAGTTGITAACDAVWTLRRQSGGECLLEITGREMEEKTYSLKFSDGDPFGWKLIGEGEQVKLSEERREIIELLRDEAPLKPAKIAILLKKNAVTVRRLLQRLVLDGIVHRNNSGGYVLSSMNAVND
jgi:predicted ATP-dependent serine protease